MRTRTSAIAAASALWVAITTAAPNSSAARRMQSQDGIAAGGIEVPGGLVGNQNRRVVHQRAGDCDALHLPAGELIGQRPDLIFQAEPSAAVP